MVGGWEVEWGEGSTEAVKICGLHLGHCSEGFSNQSWRLHRGNYEMKQSDRTCNIPPVPHPDYRDYFIMVPGNNEFSVLYFPQNPTQEGLKA